jgi:DNA-binding beta-propeller fold protein YncE
VEVSKNPCARKLAGGPQRASLARQGQAVALAREGKSTIAYIADEDSNAIHTFDVGEARALAKTELSGAPAQVLVLSDGRVAVTLRDQGEVQILEPQGLEKPLAGLCKRSVPAEPFGLAATRDDERVLVTSAWAHTLTVLDEGTLEPLASHDLPREPRAVVVDDDNRRVFVSHAVGSSVSIVDLDSKDKPRAIDVGVSSSTPSATIIKRSGAQGFALVKSEEVSVPPPAAPNARPNATEGGKISGKAPLPPTPKKPVGKAPQGRVFVPMVTVDPGDPNQRSQVYYGSSRDGLPKEVPIVSVIDTEAERPMTRAAMYAGMPFTNECLLPRAAAYRASTGTLLVSCVGIDAVVELDTRGADPVRLEKRRIDVPSGPTGLAVDDQNGRAVVWSQFEGHVTVLDLVDGKPGVIVPVATDRTPEAQMLARGRQMFHLSEDLRISNDGVACASCHADGRDDAFTWSTPEGPRQTIMLAGRAVNTAPYGWQGKHGDLRSYLGNTFSRLGGSGLQGADLEALITYLEKIQGPAFMKASSEGVRRGEKLFNDAEIGCATCHVEGSGVDKVSHDVGSRSVADNDAKFDTPSLKFIRGTAPYFHDGRYETLEDMLRATDSDMGHTSHLNAGQRADLAAYLETL